MNEQKRVDELTGLIGQAIDHNSFLGDERMETINMQGIAKELITHGVTVQEWISASKPPKENGYYLCVILSSAVGNKRKYRRKILFWEDNVWIEMENSFRTVTPLYWMPMAEIPRPPKGE